MIQYAKTFGEADYISSLIKKFKKKKKIKKKKKKIWDKIPLQY